MDEGNGQCGFCNKQKGHRSPALHARWPPFWREAWKQSPSDAISNLFLITHKFQRLATKFVKAVRGCRPLTSITAAAAAAAAGIRMSDLSNAFVPRGTGKFLGTFALFSPLPFLQTPLPGEERGGGGRHSVCQSGDTVPQRWARPDTGLLPRGLTICQNSRNSSLFSRSFVRNSH